MRMVSSVSVILDTGDTYICYSNKGELVHLEEKILPIKLKGIAKGLKNYRCRIFECSIRSESVCIIALWA